MRRNILKAQAAMEYLTTYGWAILVIALVLAVLYKFVFLSGLGYGSTCTPLAGYLCSNPTLGTNGNLSMIFSVGGGSTVYNLGMACTATTTGTLPSPTTAMIYLSSTGAATAVSANSPAAGALSLQPQQTVTVSGLKCFDIKGTALSSSSLSVGSPFGGTLWANFTLSSGAPGASNPMITTEFATIRVTVV